MQPVVTAAGELSNDEVRRYGRHLIMPEFGMEGQRRLKASSVLLIGTGGLGSPLALYLAAAGIGRIGLVDYDVVDDSNLQRQIVHGQSSLGVPKIESAARRMLDINPHLEIDRYEEPITSENALRIIAPYDVIIDGTDNFPTRYLVNDACVKLGKPNVYGSVLRFEGQATVFYAQAGGPCYRCMFPEPPPPGLVPNCAEAGVLGVLPGVIGTIQATEAIKLLTGIGESLMGRMLLYDALDMNFDFVRVRKNPNCPVCGIPAEEVELIDYEQFCGVPAHDHSTFTATGTANMNGHTPNGAHLPVPQISVRELKQRIDAGEDLLILDVRNPEEFEIAVLDGTLRIPKPRIEMDVADIRAGRRQESDTVLAQLPRDREILVHCRSGVRSVDIIHVLRAQGYDPAKLINVDGGIIAWAVEIDPTMPTY
ncbi:MAG: molybdopterin-synthase adenylyltransferase MoeB [Chloroflexi bacterium]|nr:molybdopterin-synthase adenylyltransferase MoeB [Chloroflexota bacterium]